MKFSYYLAKWKGEENLFVPYPYGVNPHGITGKGTQGLCFVGGETQRVEIVYILSSFLSPHLQGIRRLRGQCRGFLLGRWLLFHYMVFNGSASWRKISRVRWENDEEVTGSQILKLVRDRFLLEVETFLNNTDSYRLRIFR